MARFAALMATWVALWGEVNPANVLTGFVLAVVLSVMFPSASKLEHRIHVVGALKFLGRFIVDLVTSSVTVAAAVLRPTKERLAVKVVDVDLHTTDPLMVAVICNAMTLTPGTMTVAVDDSTSTMRLHVLGDIDAATVQQHVHELEARVMAAVWRKSDRRRGG